MESVAVKNKSGDLQTSYSSLRDVVRSKHKTTNIKMSKFQELGYTCNVYRTWKTELYLVISLKLFLHLGEDTVLVFIFT